MMLTVALVDDHPLFREGIRAVLSAQPDVEVVAEASDSRQACAAVASTKPAVVVIDMTLPDGDGIAATQEVLRQAPRTRESRCQSVNVSYSRASERTIFNAFMPPF